MFQGTYRGSPELLEAYHLMYARANRRTRKPTGHNYHPSKHGPHTYNSTYCFFSQPAARLFSSFLCSWVIFLDGPHARSHAAAPCGPMRPHAPGFSAGTSVPRCPAVPSSALRQCPAASSQQSAVSSSQFPVPSASHTPYRISHGCVVSAPRTTRHPPVHHVWCLVFGFGVRLLLLLLLLWCLVMPHARAHLLISTSQLDFRSRCGPVLPSKAAKTKGCAPRLPLPLGLWNRNHGPHRARSEVNAGDYVVWPIYGRG
jgi:hypothetical protein